MIIVLDIAAGARNAASRRCCCHRRHCRHCRHCLPPALPAKGRHWLGVCVQAGWDSLEQRCWSSISAGLPGAASHRAGELTAPGRGLVPGAGSAAARLEPTALPCMACCMLIALRPQHLYLEVPRGFCTAAQGVPWPPPGPAAAACRQRCRARCKLQPFGCGERGGDHSSCSSAPDGRSLREAGRPEAGAHRLPGIRPARQRQGKGC